MNERFHILSRCFGSSSATWAAVLALLLTSTFCSSLTATPEKGPALSATSVQEAQLWLLWHPDVLRGTGLRITVAGQFEPAQEGVYLHLPSADAAVLAHPGRFDGFAGAFAGTVTWQFDHQIAGRPTQRLRLDLHLQALDALRWRWRDANGADWLWLGAGHPRMSADRRHLDYSGAELRAGPALADWLSAPELVDQPLASVIGSFRLQQFGPALDRGSVDAALGCPVPPRWPNTPIDPGNLSLGRYQADVHLIAMTAPRFLRCRQLAQPMDSCDGPGGTEGEVVLAPDAQLQNSGSADAADVPWYRQFLGQFPPYDNDQHPFLIWNLYRLDADGTLRQIGRSGLKHAFVTINNGCTLGCSPPPPATANNVLYPNCSDVYSVGTNDSALFLGPRSELLPAAGLWGRCGSVFDPDCDGDEDPTGADPYTHRMVVRESALDTAMHPGARYFADAWYVVRDDVNIDNTMGQREVQPSFSGGIWTLSFVDAQLQPAPMALRWLSTVGSPDAVRWYRRVRLSDGEWLLAARVDQLGPSSWHYRYVLANLDHAIAQTEGNAPNLRILNTHGLGGLQLSIDAAVGLSSIGYADGDADPGNDWPAIRNGNQLSWTAPTAGAELRWGNLISVGFDSDLPPGLGSIAVRLQQGEDDAIVLQAPIPGAELLSDGFESFDLPAN
ncbi:MAG: hypothetical protein R3F15_21590 [Lysobacterales bacterium]